MRTKAKLEALLAVSLLAFAPIAASEDAAAKSGIVAVQLKAPGPAPHDVRRVQWRPILDDEKEAVRARTDDPQEEPVTRRDEEALEELIALIQRQGSN